jgi:hypothetical protein
MAVGRDTGDADAVAGDSREAKASQKTTESIFLVLVLVGVLVVSKTVSAEGGRGDWFRADQAWLYITILTVGYMVSRGLAKSGSHDPYAPSTGSSGIGERLGAAVGAFKEGPAGEGTTGRAEGGRVGGSYQERI